MKYLPWNANVAQSGVCLANVRILKIVARPVNAPVLGWVAFLIETITDLVVLVWKI